MRETKRTMADRLQGRCEKGELRPSLKVVLVRFDVSLGPVFVDPEDASQQSCEHAERWRRCPISPCSSLADKVAQW